MTFYNINDIAVDSEMDLVIENNDIAISDSLSTLSSIISNRVIGDPSEWKFRPEAMAGLMRFHGEVLDNDLKEKIANDIANAINFGQFLAISDIKILVNDIVDKPNELSLEVSLHEISYIDKDGNEHNDAFLQTFYNMDLNSGKLTFIDDLF